MVDGGRVPALRPAFAARRQAHQRHDMLVSRHHLVRLESKGAARHLRQGLHVSEQTADARLLSRKRMSATYVADDVVREVGLEHLQITTRECLMDTAPEGNVWMFRHAQPPLRPTVLRN